MQINVRWLLEHASVVETLTHIDPERGLTQAWTRRIDCIALRLAQQSRRSREVVFSIAPDLSN